jgi:ketosteroid isomerase-like protein
MENPRHKLPSAFRAISLLRTTSLLLFALTLFLTRGVRAQDSPDSPTSSDLYDTIAVLDSALFETFNNCQLDKNATFFTEDVEFYHDQGGVTLGRDNLVASLRKNICGGTTKVRRELVKGSLVVDQINNYGAVEIGEHRFYQTEKGRPERLTGVAKFVHIWQKKDGQWRISRVISYAHKAVEQK